MHLPDCFDTHASQLGETTRFSLERINTKPRRKNRNKTLQKVQNVCTITTLFALFFVAYFNAAPFIQESKLEVALVLIGLVCLDFILSGLYQ